MTSYTQQGDTDRSPWLARVHWGVVMLLAGYLLFAHGCHGEDHDDELFTSCVTVLGGQR